MYHCSGTIGITWASGTSPEGDFLYPAGKVGGFFPSPGSADPECQYAANVRKSTVHSLIHELYSMRLEAV